MKFLLYIFLFAVLVGCNNEEPKEKVITPDEIPYEKNEVEQNIYSEVKIGEQIWMSENLKEKTFSNGDVIKQAKSFLEWKNLCKQKKPAWCFNNFKEGNDILYNWFAINDDRGIAPKDYRMSNLNDWKVLGETLENEFKDIKKYIEEDNYIKIQEIESRIAIALASKEDWFEVYDNNNSSNFNALPFGYLNSDGIFSSKNMSTFFWTREGGTIFLGNDGGFIFSINTDSYYTEWNEGYSVRCIKK